jgi:hypothetical protein
MAKTKVVREVAETSAEFAKKAYDEILDFFGYGADAEEIMSEADKLSPQTRNVLKALERDDFLGFETPDQALKQYIEDPVYTIMNYDLSPQLKGSLTKFANNPPSKPKKTMADVAPRIGGTEKLSTGAEYDLSSAQKTQAEGATNLFDMLFLHNTDADKLKRIQDMGGMPMPSIAATKKDIPFEEFGDITLIGRKDQFAPDRQNKWWDADAYTTRAPSPFQLAQKGAGKRFDADYSEYKKFGSISSGRNIWDLESKKGVDESSYKNVLDFFETGAPALAKFADDSGIAIPDKASLYDLRDIRDTNRDAFDKWMSGEIDKYLDPQQYFVSKPSQITDYGRTSVGIKPYTADELTKFMKKSRGKSQEQAGGVTPNEHRAALSRPLKSIDAIRASRDMLQPYGDETKAAYDAIAEERNGILDALGDYFIYGGNSYPEASRALISSDKLGLDRALREYGFDNVPDNIKDSIKSLQNKMQNAPTNFFEGKPERTVSLGEFAGAIVPENTPQETLGLLQRFGIDVQKYSDDAQRTALRDKFSKEMFVRPETVIASGLLSDQQGQQLSGYDQAKYMNQQMQIDNMMGNKNTDVYNYGDILPVKRNNVTGEYSLANTGVVEDVLRGLLDIGLSRKSGMVKPTSILDMF